MMPPAIIDNLSERSYVKYMSDSSVWLLAFAKGIVDATI
jgi:hypothetical protein